MGQRMPIGHQDGTGASACAECAARWTCPAGGAHPAAVETSRVPRDVALLRADQLREDRIYIVRSGAFKRVSLHPSGTWQVTAFHLAGELLGLGAPDQLRHGSYTVALEDSSVCAITLDPSGASPPRLLPALNDALQRECKSNQFLRQPGCSRRLASFLLDIGKRQALRGYSDRMLRLAMNWRDIASYLQMTPESVSRSLLRLKLDGALTLHGKHVQLRKQSALHELAQAPATQALPTTATRH